MSSRFKIEKQEEGADLPPHGTNGVNDFHDDDPND